MKKLIFTIFIMISMVCGQSYAQNKLTIVVDGIEEIKGKLFVALFNSPSTFLKKGYKGKIVDIESNVIEVEFTDLPTGEYAISLYQDENENGKLDTGLFGIPTEKYAFSNSAEGFMGAPSFKSCKFNLDGNKVVHLTVN